MVDLEMNNKTRFSFPRRKITLLLDLARKKLKIRKKQAISLAFVTPSEIKKLNRIYRGKSRATDVLTFNSWEGQILADDILGEIIICPSQAKKQARDFKTTFAQEIFRLALHGYLHLLGFDHQKQAKSMEKLEEKILSDFYAEY